MIAFPVPPTEPAREPRVVYTAAGGDADADAIVDALAALLLASREPATPAAEEADNASE